MTYDPFDPFDPLNEPTMHDLFLKFPDEQTANEVLFTAGTEPVYTEEVSTATVYIHGFKVDGDPFEFPYFKKIEDKAEFLQACQECYYQAFPDAGEVSFTYMKYLRTTEQQFKKPVQTGEKVVYTPKYTAVDVLGTIYKPTGNKLQTPEGEVDEMAPLDGWHANVRHKEEAPELEQYRVNPKVPQRMWA